MQSSYSLIKKNFATQGENKVISTKYVSEKSILEDIKEEREKKRGRRTKEK